MAQVIKLNRTITLNPPPVLAAGEPGVCVAPGATKMWLSDGVANRLILSSDPADTAIMTANLLKLTGGAMSGAIELIPPVNPQDATNKQYVDAQIANLRLFKGTWRVGANVPDIVAAIPTLSAGDYYMAVTASPTVPENAPAGAPGIGGQSINNGDLVLWDAGGAVYDLVRGGPLTVADANALYVQLAGGIMTGVLTLSGNPSAADHAANKAYVDSMVNTLAALMVPLGGGTMTGPLILDADPTALLGAATKQYVDNAAASGFTGVVTDASLTGNGMAGTPLSVDIIDGGVF